MYVYMCMCIHMHMHVDVHVHVYICIYMLTPPPVIHHFGPAKLTLRLALSSPLAILYAFLAVTKFKHALR